MLGRERSVGFHSNSTTLIAQGTTVEGDLNFTGNMEIEGAVKGNIIASGDVKGTVRILENGIVEGEIHAPSVVINGTVRGDVYSDDHIELAAKAVVTGNVHYHLIEMVKGAQVNGNLLYGGAEQSADDTPMLTERFDGEAEDSLQPSGSILD